MTHRGFLTKLQSKEIKLRTRPTIIRRLLSLIDDVEKLEKDYTNQETTNIAVNIKRIENIASCFQAIQNANTPSAIVICKNLKLRLKESENEYEQVSGDCIGRMAKLYECYSSEMRLINSKDKHIRELISVVKNITMNTVSKKVKYFRTTQFLLESAPSNAILMESGETVILDTTRNIVRVYNTDEWEEVGHLSLGGVVHSIAKTELETPTLLASIPGQKKVVMFDINDKKVNIVEEVNLSTACFSIAPIKDELYAINDKGTITQLSFTDKKESFVYLTKRPELKEFDPSDSQICVNMHKKLLVVTFPRRDTIMGFHLDGRVRWCLVDHHLLQGLRGMAFVFDKLHVCCEATASVLLVGNDGKIVDDFFGKIVDLHRPLAVSFGFLDGTFLVSDNHAGHELKYISCKDLAYDPMVDPLRIMHRCVLL
ncbi:uncharacterized protein LOC128205713 [Mya arenaria]|uniref:uncharacterized protein LOC128205713 n=1 Tax=Mya arenaria TaxID=6604 RepID=UPI0022E1978D|nr:uncharacterized protein LOC128205713 [Mya arenaria]